MSEFKTRVSDDDPYRLGESEFFDITITGEGDSLELMVVDSVGNEHKFWRLNFYTMIENYLWLFKDGPGDSAELRQTLTRIECDSRSALSLIDKINDITGGE